jgi:hypothetical protein
MGLRRLYFHVDRGDVAHYLEADGTFFLPVALIGILGLSYVTRPASRRGSAKARLASQHIRGDRQPA